MALSEAIAKARMALDQFQTAPEAVLALIPDREQHLAKLERDLKTKAFRSCGIINDDARLYHPEVLPREELKPPEPLEVLSDEQHEQYQ